MNVEVHLEPVLSQVQHWSMRTYDETSGIVLGIMLDGNLHSMVLMK